MVCLHVTVEDEYYDEKNMFLVGRSEQHNISLWHAR